MIIWRKLLAALAAAATRQRLPDRRQGVTETLVFKFANGVEVALDVTFNPGGDGQIREAFCLAFKEGTEMRTLLHHACIIASVGLQHGATMADYLHAIGEDDLEQLPTSVLSLLTRAGVRLDEENGFVRMPAVRA